MDAFRRLGVSEQDIKLNIKNMKLPTPVTVALLTGKDALDTMPSTEHLTEGGKNVKIKAIIEQEKKKRKQP
jgi:hypothetical protein